MARSCSSSPHAVSISIKSENLRAKEECGIEVSEVVRVVTVFTFQFELSNRFQPPGYRVPWGNGENDCNMCGRGGRDDDARSSVRSDEGNMQTWGLSEYGSAQAILNEIVETAGRPPTGLGNCAHTDVEILLY